MMSLIFVRMRPGAIGASLLWVAFAAMAPSVRGQSLAEMTATPEMTAEVFLRSIRSIRWSAAAQFIDAQTLERFTATVTMMSEADTTGTVRRFLTSADAAGLAGMTPARVFDRAIGAMIEEMPGLMHSLFDRDDRVMGHVTDGADEAHVVYRTIARISGATSEVKVMQLRRNPVGWRVVWSDELEVLNAALTGIPSPGG